MKTLFRFLLLAIGVFFVSGAISGTETVGHSLTEVTQASLPIAAVAKNELRERELIKHFRHDGTWMSRVPSKNQWVNNDVIRLNEMGADPAVLINNNTYPIPVSDRTDDSTAISLFKYDTENTKVTDDELYGLPYDKIGSVQMQHRETLEEETRMHALHSLAPVGNTADTPIIETTGEDDGTGRKRLISKDLINYKKALDLLKIPKAGRILVLSSEHVADLLIEDKALERQYQNHTTGMIAKNYYGFELYEDIYSPEYDVNLDKLAYDSVATGRKASVLFHAKGCAKARGSATAYVSKAKDNPTMRETVMGFRLWFLAIPTRSLGQGAIVSGTVV